MPIYEYACEKCGNAIDLIQKVGAKPPPKCEKCGAKGKMKRSVSRTSFVLKGGGWGADLYGSKKSESATKAPDTKESSSSSTSTPAASTPSSSGTDKK